MRSFSQLKVNPKQKQLPDVSLILQDTELWTVVKLYPFCFLSFPRQKQIKEWEKKPKPLLRDNCAKENSGVNVFIVGVENRKGAKCKGKAWKLNHCAGEWDQSHVLVILGKPSIGNLPAERDLFDSYHLSKTGSDGDWELEICQEKGVCC